MLMRMTAAPDLTGPVQLARPMWLSDPEIMCRTAQEALPALTASSTLSALLKPTVGIVNSRGHSSFFDLRSLTRHPIVDSIVTFNLSDLCSVQAPRELVNLLCSLTGELRKPSRVIGGRIKTDKDHPESASGRVNNGIILILRHARLGFFPVSGSSRLREYPLIRQTSILVRVLRQRKFEPPTC
ncbi:hypothetical protein J6590_033353 [Homalodisca vitripennis]|nr:hypothetical protein J6590_033353 [Homalodisca vitripennis]